MLRFIVPLGKPLSGKDTIGDLLSQEIPNTRVLSPGSIYRQARIHEGEFAKYHDLLAPYFTEADQGNFFPNQVTMTLVKNVICDWQQEGTQTIILSGFPRNVEQLHAFDNLTQDLEGKTQQSIQTDYLWIPITHKTYKRRGNTRSLVEKRPDDTPEGFTKRLEKYHELTKPMIAELAEKGKLTIVKSYSWDSPDDVQEKVRQALGIRKEGEKTTDYARNCGPENSRP